MPIIAVLIGGALGAALEGGFGLVAGAVLGWLLARSVLQGREIAALQKALGLQSPSVPQPRPAATDERPAPAVAVPIPAAHAGASASTANDPFFDEPVTLPAPRAATPSAARPPAAPRADLLAPIRRWMFGGNTIVKAGVGILFIGLAFLAKFATEHAQIPVELRLAGIGAVALVLLGIGWRLRLARPGYAQVMQGGAVAVLYLTLFVAFRYYGVLAVGPVFVAMAAVAALAAGLAVMQEARALAVVGAIGGFAAPLLVSTGGGNVAALFGYYLVLDLGIAAVAWFRTWRSLNLVGFVATFGVAGAWGGLKYQPDQYALSQFFLLAFFVVFVAILLLPTRRPADPAPASRSDAWVQGSLLFGLPTVVFALQYGLVRDTPFGSALSALAMAAFYVVLALWMRSRPALATVFEASLAVGTVFLTLVIPFAVDARSTAGAWALEGAGLVWLGFRQSRRLPRGFGYALLLLAGGSMAIAMERFGIPDRVFNPVLFNAAMAGAAALAAAGFVRRHARHPVAALAEPLLVGWAVLWLVGAAALQFDAFVADRFVPAAWLGFGSGLALLCTGLALRLDWARVSYVAIGHAPLMALVLGAGSWLLASPLHAGGWWAWPLALATHLAVLARAAPRWPGGFVDAGHALGALVLAGLGALIGRSISAGWGDAESAWPWLGWMLLPAGLLMLLPRPAIALRWPVSAAPSAYRWNAAGLLAVGALLWTVIANVASDGSARPLPHLPLANPLDIGIGFALLAGWRWLRSEEAQVRLGRGDRIATGVLAAAGFVWLNAILVRAFHHYGGVPYRLHAWSGSLAVQTGLTLLWTASALVVMWLAARRSARLPWMVGAALLVAVVAKLMLVDLDGAGSVTRIVSFIGVGALMLVIGYVAPPPAREATHALA